MEEARLSPTDGEVVTRVLGGDVDAFGVLVERYQHELTAYARYMTSDLDEAADVVQECLVRAYRQLARCREPERFKGWLFRMVSNECKSHLRRRKRRKDRPMAEALAAEPVDEATPHDAAEAADARRRVREALQRVTSEQREALLMFYMHGLELAEIATSLSISVAAVKMRLQRGRAALLEQLKGLVL